MSGRTYPECQRCPIYLAQDVCDACNIPMCLNCTRVSHVTFKHISATGKIENDVERVKTCTTCSDAGHAPVMPSTSIQTNDSQCIIS